MCTHSRMQDLLVVSTCRLSGCLDLLVSVRIQLRFQIVNVVTVL